MNNNTRYCCKPWRHYFTVSSISSVQSEPKSQAKTPNIFEILQNGPCKCRLVEITMNYGLTGCRCSEHIGQTQCGRPSWRTTQLAPGGHWFSSALHTPLSSNKTPFLQDRYKQETHQLVGLGDTLLLIPLSQASCKFLLIVE